MLIEKQKKVYNCITFTKGDLELVLTINNGWMFAQDVQNNTDVLETKIFSFGERYGIVKRDSNNISYVNINGKPWYLSTVEETSMPVLKDVTYSYSNKVFPNFIELRDMAEYKYALAW